MLGRRVNPPPLANQEFELPVIWKSMDFFYPACSALTRLPAAASLHCEIPVTLFPDGALKLGRQGRVMSLGHLSEAALPELWHQGAGRTLGDGQGILRAVAP